MNLEFSQPIYLLLPLVFNCLLSMNLKPEKCGKKPKIHEERTTQYFLEVLFVEGDIEIRLKVMKDQKIKNFGKVIKGTNLPISLEKYLFNIENVFESLKSKESHEVIPENGEIVLKVRLKISQKQSQHQTIIRLEEKHLTDNQQLEQHILYLTEVVSDLKKKVQAKDIETEKKMIMQKNFTVNKQQSDYFKIQFENFDTLMRERFRKIQLKMQNYEIYDFRLKKLQMRFQNMKADMQKRVNSIEQSSMKYSQSEKRQTQKIRQLEEEIDVLSGDRRQSQIQEIIKSIEINSTKLQQQQEYNIFPEDDDSEVDNHGFTNISDSLFEMNTPFVKYFFLDHQNKIAVCRSDSKNSLQILTTVVISYQQILTFQCKITQSKSKSIFIGVVDRKMQKNQAYSYCSGNALSLYGGGRVWFGSLIEGKWTQTKLRFKKGDKVMVSVNRKEGKVLWKVNDQQQYVLYSEILLEEDREFVPYFEMKFKGDGVQLLC